MMLRALTAALVVLVLATAGASAGSSTAATPLATLVGARLVVGMEGTTPSPALLKRIRRGRVGGVILMGANVRSAPQVRALTASLRAAARAGGRPLLIMTDQEGGEVRRFRWAPPAASAEELGTRQATISEWENDVYRPRGASAQLLNLVAERAGFEYEVTSDE